MKVLVVYGTAEGQTRKIAQWIAERIASRGYESQLHDAEAPLRDLNVAAFDAIIAAAPVHQQAHPQAVRGFVRAHLDTLSTKPSAFVSVSLSAAFKDGLSEADSYVDQFLEETGWRPTKYHLAAGAIRCDEYDFFKDQIVRHIVLRDRAPAKFEGDQEFTDWSALGSFVDDFVQMSEC